MKNKIVLVVSSIAITLVLGIVVIGTREKSVSENTEVEYVESLSETIEYDSKKDSIMLYVWDKNHYVFPIIKEINKGTLTEQVVEIFEIYTKYSNTLPSEIVSPVVKSTKLVDVKINNNSIVLNMSEEFNNYNLEYERKIFEALAYTYTQFVDIEKVYFEINDNDLEYGKGGFPLKNGISRNMNLNLVLDTKNPSNSKEVIIYYLSQSNKEDYFIPVTYLVDKDIAVGEYIINTMANTNNLNLDTCIRNYIDIIQEPYYEKDVLVININDNVFAEDIDINSSTTFNQIYLTFAGNYNVKELSLLINGEIIGENLTIK